MDEVKTVELKPNENSEAKLIGYLHDIDEEEMPNRLTRPCVLICPGGGYEYQSAREADPPAFSFFSRGYNVFILYYSVKENAGQLRPLIDISNSVLLIRENSGAWGIQPDNIAVMGFSAGAHVAASLGTLWNSSALKEKTDTRNGQNKPNAMILCYPVITGGEFAHRGSFDWLTEGKNTPEDIAFYSLENQVTDSTPPAFLWHTVDDATVPVQNTLLFASALQKNHIPFECHIYPSGVHGLSMCNTEVNTKNEHCATWFPLCVKWLDELFSFEY